MTAQKKLKRVFPFLVLMLLASNAKANFIVEVHFRYKLWVGHGVTMYCSVENLDSLYSRALRIDTLKERSILASFGLPLIKHNHGDEGCVIADELNFELKTLFKKRRHFTFKFGNREIFVQVKALKKNHNLCVFPLYTKAWGSYDVHFKEAGVITELSKTESWTRREKRFFKEVYGHLSMVPRKL